jgi:sarcosine oxidase / L-pipecolate oxidase
MSHGVKSVIVIGGGNFGAATALELKQQDPAIDVTIIDKAPFPNPTAASHDVSKIIRPDYADSVYMSLMAEAMSHWRTSDLYAPFYYEVGLLRVDESDFGDRCIDNYKRTLGYKDDAKVPAKWLSLDEVRAMHAGAFLGANFDGVDRVLWNAESGWAAADKALEAVISHCVQLGVKYIELGVRKLDIDEVTGKCVGVTLGDGRKLTAQKIVLCAGVHSGVLLADSAPNSEDIQAGDRIVVTGAVSFTVNVDGELKERLRGVPVVKNCLEHTKGKSESIITAAAPPFDRRG